MGKNSANKTEESKKQKSNIGSVNPPVPLPKGVVATDLSAIATLVTPAVLPPKLVTKAVVLPPKVDPPVAVAEKDPPAFVLESLVDARTNETKWTKVLFFDQESKEWQTGIITNPSTALPIGAMIKCKIGREKKGTRTVYPITGVTVIAESSIISKLYAFLFKDDNHSESELQEWYFSDLAAELMKDPIEDFKQFMDELGIDYIVGAVAANRIIVKALPEWK